MQLKTILNRAQKFKSFVYGSARWVNEARQPAVEMELHAKRPQPSDLLGLRSAQAGITGWRRDALSLFLSGDLRCSFSTRHGEWTAPAVG